MPLYILTLIHLLLLIITIFVVLYIILEINQDLLVKIRRAELTINNFRFGKKLTKEKELSSQHSMLGLTRSCFQKWYIVMTTIMRLHCYLQINVLLSVAVSNSWTIIKLLKFKVKTHCFNLCKSYLKNMWGKKFRDYWITLKYRRIYI